MIITGEATSSGCDISIADDYALALDVLAELGWRDPEEEGIPASKTITSSITDNSNLSKFLIDRAQQGIGDRLIISPTVGGEHGIGVAETIRRFNPRAFDDIRWFGKGVVTQVWGNRDGTGNPFSDKGIIHDNASGEGLTNKWDITIYLRDVPENEILTGIPIIDNAARGIMLRQKSHSEQRQELAAEQSGIREAYGVDIISAGIGAVLVDTVGRRLGKEKAVFPVTRLIHYPERELKYPFGRHIPAIGGPSEGSHFMGESTNDDSSTHHWRGGIRRLVRVPITSE